MNPQRSKTSPSAGMRTRRMLGSPDTIHRTLAAALLATCLAVSRPVSADDFRPVPLHGRITGVQPMTGLVMWESSENCRGDAVQLEFSYLRYDDVVRKKGQYDWSAVERKLRAIAGRG